MFPRRLLVEYLEVEPAVTVTNFYIEKLMELHGTNKEPNSFAKLYFPDECLSKLKKCEEFAQKTVACRNSLKTYADNPILFKVVYDRKDLVIKCKRKADTEWKSIIMNEMMEIPMIETEEMVINLEVAARKPWQTRLYKKHQARSVNPDVEIPVEASTQGDSILELIQDSDEEEDAANTSRGGLDDTLLFGRSSWQIVKRGKRKCPDTSTPAGDSKNPRLEGEKD